MIKSEKSENIPDTVLRETFPGSDDDDVIDAAHGKFDAIIDALAATVLPLKVKRFFVMARNGINATVFCAYDYRTWCLIYGVCLATVSASCF